MLKKCLSLMLILLITCQSVWAMADNHPLTQPETAHVETGHNHDSLDKAPVDLKASSLSDTSSALDCNHCCHCHGSSPLFVSTPVLSLPQSGELQQLLSYSQSFQTPYLPADFRPPIT